MQKATFWRVERATWWARLGALVGLSFLLPILLYDNARTDHTECHSDELRAKQEGRVLLYSSLPSSDVKILSEAFRKKFPQIQVELFGASSQNLLQKLTGELRAGRSEADIVLTLGSTLEQIKSLAESPLVGCPPEDKNAYPMRRVDPSFKWTGVSLNLRVLAFNTGLVSLKDRPREYKDLLDPKWKGKIIFNPNDLVWFAGLTKVTAEMREMEFVRGLAKQDPILLVDVRGIYDRIAAGKIPLALNMNPTEVSQFKLRGSPMDFAFIRPVIADAYGVGVLTKAPHPNAGRLFVKFLTSTEGQNTILEVLKRTPARIDIATGIEDLSQKDISVLDAKEFVEKRNLFATELKESFRFGR